MGTLARKAGEQDRHHRAHWAEVHDGTSTYVALGDSAGVGVGVDDPARSYVGIIARRLAETTGHTVRTVNLSVSGATAKHVLDAQLPRLAELPTPHFVTCVVGGNDVAWARTFREGVFARDMHAIAALLPEKSVMGLLPRFVHWPYKGRAEKANRAIREAASANDHTVADIHTATTRLSLRTYLGTFASDYFHPNEAGHALWADAVWPHLTPR